MRDGNGFFGNVRKNGKMKMEKVGNDVGKTQTSAR